VDPCLKEFFSTRYLKERYDRIAESYMGSRALFDNMSQLEMLAELIPIKSKVLDLGCGTGLPVAKFFSDRGHEVIGIDLSDRMIALARANVPNGKFFINDVMEILFDEDCFDLIVSFYCLVHLSKDNQRTIFNNIIHWLKVGGYFYFSLGTKEYTGMDDFEGTINYKGTFLPYCYYSCEDYQNIFRTIGGKVVVMEELTIGGETLLWVLLEKL